MQRLIDIDRAARVAGVTAAEIQRHIDDGSLPFKDGRITLDDLGRLYPDVADSRAGMLEYVSQVKDDVAHKRRRKMYDSVPREELQRQLAAAQREAAHYRARLEDYRRVLVDLHGMLQDAQARDASRQRCEAVVQWLDHKLRDLA